MNSSTPLNDAVGASSHDGAQGQPQEPPFAEPLFSTISTDVEISLLEDVQGYYANQPTEESFFPSWGMTDGYSRVR